MLHSRHEAETLLSDATAAAGAALLDGKPADLDAVTRARNELTAIDAAEAEAIRRERLAEREKVAAERRENREALRHALEAYGKAVVAADAAVKAMVDAMGVVEVLGSDIAGLAYDLGGRVPTKLAGNEPAQVHSSAIALQLQRLGGPNSYGILSWPSIGSMSGHVTKKAEVGDWPDFARRHVTAAVAPLLEGND